MNSYLFWLSIIDIICVVCIVVVYEIRLGRIKEVADNCYQAWKDESWEAAGEIEYLNCELEEIIKELQDEVSRREPGENICPAKGISSLALYRINGSYTSIMEEAQKRG